MENLEKRGCVYFFKHVGLSPVKIGYSENESPIPRFTQFKTYAPFGAELLGFIPSCNAKRLETELHRKHSDKRLKGEWFNISIEMVNNEINFHSDLEDIKSRNNFQIAWAKSFIPSDEVFFEDSNLSKKEVFIIRYKRNKNLNITNEAKYFKVSRMAIYKWIKSIKKNEK